MDKATKQMIVARAASLAHFAHQRGERGKCLQIRGEMKRLKLTKQYNVAVRKLAA